MPDSPPPAWSEEDLRALAVARDLLDRDPFAVRVAHALGKPIERSLALLPEAARRLVNGATHTSVERALGVALRTLRDKPGAKGHDTFHGWAAAASGATGGLFGLPGLAVELPVTTVIMLRSVAAIARREGFSFADPRVRLACVEVFALGGGRPDTDAAETGYYAVRAALASSISEALAHVANHGLGGPAAPVFVRLVSRIAARFGFVVEEKLLLESIPLVGAIGGALVNSVFMEHFQRKARGHFTILRLEAKYGGGEVRENYRLLTSGR